ncbi:hypothetical protein [Ekhidna sp. To15]|uniref:hypothetical protein n=1 Tax=Ekhidna sp. To15 TaxID=3395267 RepID=UPI003F51BEFB
MAQLHDVVGAILRDIAQSRVTSDLYSREVSRYYEEDSLLRLFPIPRTEIKEVEIDLNFGISDVRKDATRDEDKLVYVSRMIQRYSDKLTEQVFESLRGSSLSKIGKSNAWQQLVDSLDSVDLRSSIKFSIIDFFESNQSTLINESEEVNEDEDNVSLNIDKEAAEGGLMKIIDRTILNIDTVKELLAEEELENSLENSLERGLEDQLDAMDTDLNFELQAYALDITTNASDLAEMPENAISKIKITAEVKNYTWSQVEEKDNKVVRRLIPE